MSSSMYGPFIDYFRCAIHLRFFVIALLLFVNVFVVGEARAQQIAVTTTEANKVPVGLEDPQSKEAVRELVSALSDDSVRALLIQRLDAVAEANEKKAAGDQGAFGVLGLGFRNFWNNALEASSRLGEIPAIFSGFGRTLSKSMLPGGMSKFFLVILFAIAAGIIAERIVVFLFRKKKQKLIDEVSSTLSGILRIIYGRLSFDIFGVFAFGVVSYIVISNYYVEGTLVHDLSYLVIAAIFSAWLGFMICRFFFAPKRPEIRICLTSDARAMKLTVSFSLLAGFVVLVHNSFYLFARISIENLGGFTFMSPLGFVMNMSLYLIVGYVIFLNREGLSEVMVENKKRIFKTIGEQTSENISWFAEHWPKVAMVLIGAKYLLVEIVVNTADIAVYSTAAVYITFIVIFLWPGIDANISLFVAKGITVPEDETDAASKARRGMQQGLLRVGRVLVVGAVLYSLARLWGVNILDLAQAGLGAQAAGKLIEFLLIALIAYMTWELVSIIISRWMAMEGGDPDDHEEEAGGEIGGVGLSRVATLLPIIRRSAQFMIVVVSIIMVLDNWGVNIGPILAGAGVVGLAIGFGAQTLVKDIVSGLFFLADDAFRVGEYIDVGGTMGNVEKISLRSLRLRHHRGLVHTIPYGEIPKLTNFSRDWVIMKLRFRVPFETDINKVKKIFKTIGADLLQDPILGEDFLQPFKSQGVAEVDDNGIIVRGKFMAKPGKQFMIRKEVYVRVQKAFEAANIPFARKQVMVHIPGLEKAGELDKNDIQAIGAAASEAAEESMEELEKLERNKKNDQ